MTEALVFRVALGIAALHAVDDALLHRQPGVGAGQHLLALALALAGAGAAAVAYPRLRPGVRAALAFAFGGLALVNGALHAVHVLLYGPAASDLSGLLALTAGVVLVGLAAAVPWRHRGSGAATRAGRVRNRVLATAGGFLAMLFVLGPLGLAISETHKWREPVGDPPSAAYRAVAFRASDGLELRGWYRPTRNGATVLVLHGGGSDRRGAVRHSELLARRGYGVLLYDARGRGESEGTPNGYGWDWGKDVAGALRFLAARPEVDRERIGALGLSTGADVLLEVVALGGDLHAVVADGAAAGSFEDWRRLRGTELGLPPGFVMFAAMRVLSGDPPGPPLEDLMARIEQPTLLISAGTDVERDFNVIYDKAARVLRVVGFLNEALL